MAFPSQNLTSTSYPAISRVGRFRIERELGRGSIGTVYLSHDPIIDRSIAVKTLNSQLPLGQKKQYEQHFINEARAAGRLSHPNIVTIFDASSENGTTYIAMEYLRGQELSRMLEAGHQFSLEEKVIIALKIAEALHYAHKNGVIHRDIKPANIFIVEDNQPKVVDFGIARSPNRIPEHEGDQAYTLFKNNLLGTPNYMSPEQAMGRPVDHRTDLYSLGVIMYEMLAGRKPFKSRDTGHLLQQIAFIVPPVPHTINPNLPIVLSNIVMKALSKRPEKRYQSGHEMARDIRRFLATEKRNRRNQEQSAGAIEVKKTEQRAAPLKRRRLLWAGCAVMAGAIAAIGTKRR